MPVVVAAEAFEQIDRQSPILRRSVGQLMARPVIFANGNGDILVEVERNDQALGKDVHDVVVAI